MGHKHMPVALTGNDQEIVGGCGWVRFVSISETSGSALVHWQLYDGYDVTGRLMADVYMPQGTNIFSGINRGSLGFKNALWIHKVSGAYAGAFHIDMCEGPAEWEADVEFAQAFLSHLQ